MDWFGLIAVGLTCFWLALIGVTWASFGGFFAAIFALAWDHVTGAPASDPRK